SSGTRWRCSRSRMARESTRRSSFTSAGVTELLVKRAYGTSTERALQPAAAEARADRRTATNGDGRDEGPATHVAAGHGPFAPGGVWGIRPREGCYPNTLSMWPGGVSGGWGWTCLGGSARCADVGGWARVGPSGRKLLPELLPP